MFLLFVAASLFLLDAGNAFAAPIAIRQSAKTVFVSRSFPPVLEARGRQKGKGPSSNKAPGPSKNKPLSSSSEVAHPGIAQGAKPQLIDLGLYPPRPGGPIAYLLPKNSRWQDAGPQEKKFLDTKTKPNGEQSFFDKLQSGVAKGGGLIYSEDKKGDPSTEGRQTSGFRIDNQENLAKGMDFNIQAQTNKLPGAPSLTFASCQGGKNCQATPQEMSAALIKSAEGRGPVQLLSDVLPP